MGIAWGEPTDEWRYGYEGIEKPVEVTATLELSNSSVDLIVWPYCQDDADNGVFLPTTWYGYDVWLNHFSVSLNQATLGKGYMPTLRAAKTCAEAIAKAYASEYGA